MRERLWLFLKRLWKRPGFRISSFGAAALLVAFIAPLLDRTLPEDITERFSREAVLPILNILASSMLAVTTFSLGIMVQAFRSASGQATPRAYRILMQDMTTLNVLSIFVGAFLFSLGSIVMFRAGFYGPSAAVLIFALTLACIAMIVVAILRWIAHLSQLGSLDHTLELVEKAAVQPLRRLAKEPNFGARPSHHAPYIADGAVPLLAPHSGFMQYISLAELNSDLQKHEATLWITTPPGSWVLQGTPMGYVEGMDEPLGLIDNFTIGYERTVEQDARFGMIILSEVASRALSPGVNDPGTAIDVIHRIERILWELGQGMAEQKDPVDPTYDRIIIGSVTAGDLMQDGFAALMEDGGGRFDVMSQVLKSTGRLSLSSWTDLSESALRTREAALGIIDRKIDDADAVQRLREKALKP